MLQLFTQFYHTSSLKPAEKTCWQKFYGSSISLAIAEFASQQQNPVVIITKDFQAANKLSEEITFFISAAKSASVLNPTVASAQNSNSSSSTVIPILNFPDWETLPYDSFSPHQDIISQRLLTLYQLPYIKRGIIITSVNAFMQHLPPQEHIVKNSLVLQLKDQLDITEFRHTLDRQGYHCVNKVVEHGEFALRGSIIDIFPMGSPHPYRIDLFDQQVDSIRIFDPETQLTTAKTESIKLLPAKEFPLTAEAITQFRKNWRENFSGDPTNSPIYQSVCNGESPNGIEYYLPLFFEHTISLCDYLPAATNIIAIDDIHTSATSFWQEIRKRHDELQHDIMRPLLPPVTLFWPVEELFGKLKQFPQIYAQTSNESLINNSLANYATNGKCLEFDITPLPQISIESKAPQPLNKLDNFTQNYDGHILFCVESKGRLETLQELLHAINLHPQYFSSWQEFLAASAKPKYSSVINELEHGFVCSSSDKTQHLALITESDLFGQQLVLQRRYRKQHKQIDPENVVRDLTELRPGAPVVHLEHGIGRYTGLQTLTTDEITAEFLTLEYSNNAKLYVPISSLHLISRYTGANVDNVTYSTLGSHQWEKTKRKALEKIRDVAAELLAIYAKRAAQPGTAFKLTPSDYQKFADLFPFEETPDQQQAIAAIIENMTSPRHMDRLICGDVGFGKTEVAMRAVFIAVQNNKQVAILVPTTILAQQHYLNFQDRFADWPFKIELLSRFRSAQEQKNILEQLKEGKIDIIISTHKLLQPNIKFKDLGLLVIDEEHRFGVKQKERLKALRPDVDVLTLTATPIPRTLNMAFAGIRDFSIIATPPARRLAIKTFIHERNNTIIREAIWREILRGGQVYFLHNDISTIEIVAQELNKLLPSIRLAVAHGQMREHQLEHIMSDFYHGRFNVLVCTTIIESGIDVPTANTIIIDRADHLGLAQLHQLRGRVGRSHHQAYAYLLVPNKKLLTPDARKRLEAIAAMEDLGAGFNLATHDLEIRGAGELLGSEQSGHIEGIGFSLYMEYLEEAIAALKQGQEPQWDELEKRNNIVIEIKVPTLFPADYINDVNIRLTLYKRLSTAKNTDEINLLKEEIIDRFGMLPQASKNLFRTTALKLKAEQIGIQKISASKNSGIIEFTAKPNVDPIKIINLIQTQPQSYKLKGADKLAFCLQPNPNLPADIVLLNFIDELLEKLIR